jgi:uncharacterized damage-inducible protein DinB
MTTAKQLANRLREVVLNGTWIANTNFKNELADLPIAAAVAKVGSLNTISALAQHIHYYIDGILNVFKGGSLDIRDKYSFDFAPVASQEQWENILFKLFADAEELAQKIEQLPYEKLDDVFVDEKYGTYRRNIDGMIEHSYYHLGQIVLLKKLISAGTDKDIN